MSPSKGGFFKPCKQSLYSYFSSCFGCILILVLVLDNLFNWIIIKFEKSLKQIFHIGLYWPKRLDSGINFNSNCINQQLITNLNINFS